MQQMVLKHINPPELPPLQKENYNFHKVAGLLADYGFNCIRLTDDWKGADFLAVHIDGKTLLKVQQKGSAVIVKKLQGRVAPTFMLKYNIRKRTKARSRTYWP